MPIVDTDIKLYKTKSTASADGESGGNGLGGYRSSDEIVTATTENAFDNISAAESESGDTEYRAIMVKNTHATISYVGAKVYLSSTTATPFTDLTTQLEASGSETTVAVTSGTAFPASGSIFVDDEEITYTGKTSNSFTGCTRGANGTTKAEHVVGTKVEHNQVRIAIEDPSDNSTGYIQTIATESAAPTGLSWSGVYSFSTGLSIGTLAPGEFYGIWIRRKVPAGVKAKTGITYPIAVKGETEE